MGAKLAAPDKLCINVWGDAAIGFTGMDFETAVRERMPILSILLNNFSMAIELKVMPVATEKYRSTDISGNYADFAKALGGYGERVTEPGEIMPAIKRGIGKDQRGHAGAARIHHRAAEPALVGSAARRALIKTRHCEEGVGPTKQSSLFRQLDCFASLAMTTWLRAPMPGWSIPARSAARHGSSVKAPQLASSSFVRSAGSGR